MWHFRNDKQSFVTNRFTPKSFFNLRNKDVIIETILAVRKKDYKTLRFLLKNLTKEVRNVLNNLKDHPSIIMKGADEVSVVFV